MFGMALYMVHAYHVYNTSYIYIYMSTYLYSVLRMLSYGIMAPGDEDAYTRVIGSIRSSWSVLGKGPRIA